MTTMARTPRAGLRSVGSWSLVIVLLVGWWTQFAPTYVGGPATYVLVYGTSMEPNFSQGDLVIAQEQDEYRIGDVIVMATEKDMLVIHRIVGREDGAWVTQGDNRADVDPWTAPDESVQGSAWLRIPGAAHALAAAQDQPLVAAGALAAVVYASYFLPWRQRRLAPALAEAMMQGTREPRRDGRTTLEYAILWLSVGASIATAMVLALQFHAGTFFTPNGYSALAGFAVSGAFTTYFLYRLYDGVSVAEPSKSMYALAGRLYLVDDFPECGEAKPVKSAVALRTIAEKYRLPVLHKVHPVTGRHSFMLITVQEGVFLWSPPSRRMVQEHPLAHPAADRPSTPVSPPVSSRELSSARDS